MDYSFDYIQLGKNIQKLRKEASISQEMLAEICGCSLSHISHIENGHGRPSIKLIAAIANELDVGIDRLAYGDLKNRTDYFIQELVHLTGCFEGKKRLMAFEMIKALMEILEDYKET